MNFATAVLAFCLLVNVPSALGYMHLQKMKSFPFSYLSRSRPLSTANSGFSPAIPRIEMEASLRIRKSALQRVYDPLNAISTEPLDWLMNINEELDFRRANRTPRDIVRDLTNSIRSFASNFWQYMRKVLAASMVVASSLTSAINVRNLAFANSVVAAITAVPKRAHASALKNYKQLSPTQKLATTPLFFVCNSGGQPYLQDDMQAGKPEQRVIVYFMSSEDANDYLNEMAQGNPQNLNEFRVMTTSMEKIVNRIQTRKQSRKLGRYKMSSVYRIQPSSRQCDNAERIAGAGDSAKGASSLKGVSIPMFSAKGLAVRRANGEVITPYYFALEDLQEDWEKLLEQQQHQGEEASSSAAQEVSSSSSSTSTSSSVVKKLQLPATPKVEIRDFVEVMCLSQGLSSDSLREHISGGTPATAAVATVAATSTSAAAVSSVSSLSEKQLKEAVSTPGIVPPRREIEMIRDFYRNDAGVKNEFQQAHLR